MATECASPALLPILSAVRKILGIIGIIAPILLLVMASIRLIELMRNPDDKKGLPKLRNSFIAAAIIFFIPTIVNTVMYMLDDTFTISDCWNKASSFSSGSSYVDPYDGKKKQIINSEEYDKGEKKQNTQSTTSTGETGTTTGEMGTTTQTGKYYPALEGSGFRISGASTTGGCSNSSGVYHDLSISVGNKIYAGMDGEIEYIQYLCNGILYSYGNQARLTDPTTKTYILYGHLSKFVGADAQVTQTCHEVYGKNASCGAGACSSGIKKSVILKKNVKKGELIGYTGNTGNSDGPHLHVEIHENGSSSCITDPYSAMGMR